MDLLKGILEKMVAAELLPDGGSSAPPVAPAPDENGPQTFADLHDYLALSGATDLFGHPGVGAPALFPVSEYPFASPLTDFPLFSSDGIDVRGILEGLNTGPAHQPGERGRDERTTYDHSSEPSVFSDSPPETRDVFVARDFFSPPDEVRNAPPELPELSLGEPEVVGDTLNGFRPGRALPDPVAPTLLNNEPGDSVSTEGAIVGTDGNDTLSGTADDDVILGQGGYDTISGNGGDDEIYGGADRDVLYGNDGNDTLIGGGGNDILDGGTGDNRYRPGDGDDTIIIRYRAEDHTRNRPGENDLIDASFEAGPGAGDVIQFHGFGLANYAELMAYRVDEGVPNVTIFQFPGDGSQNIIVGVAKAFEELAPDDFAFFDEEGGPDFTTAAIPADSDNLTGTAGADTISGGAGDDFIFGLAGDDILIGATGDDFLQGGDGQDTIIGGSGTDTVSFADAASGVTLALGTNPSFASGGSNDSVSGVENIHGSNGDDVLSGDSGDNLILGGGGNDTLWGGGGNDILGGGEGEDTYIFKQGDGQLTLLQRRLDQDGSDVIDLQGFGLTSFSELQGLMQGADGLSKTIITFASGDQIILPMHPGFAAKPEHFLFDSNPLVDLGGGNFGVASEETGSGPSESNSSDSGGGRVLPDPQEPPQSQDTNATDDSIVGDAGNDSLDGGAGDDYLAGNGGDDTLDGGAGDDWLFGNGGNDTISGGAGDDFISGGAGNDILQGQAGDDTFVFARNAGHDIILDFNAGDGAGDVLDVRGVTIRTFDDILARTTDKEDGTGTVIQLYQDDQVTLEGVLKADLAEDDFEYFVFNPVPPPPVPPRLTENVGTGNDDTFVISDSGADHEIFRFHFRESETDRVDVSAFGFTNFAELLENASGQYDTRIQLDEDDSVTLLGVRPTDLNPDDFIYS